MTVEGGRGGSSEGREAEQETKREGENDGWIEGGEIERWAQF